MNDPRCNVPRLGSSGCASHQVHRPGVHRTGAHRIGRLPDTLPLGCRPSGSANEDPPHHLRVDDKHPSYVCVRTIIQEGRFFSKKMKSDMGPRECPGHLEELKRSRELVSDFLCGFWFGLESDLTPGKSLACPAVAWSRTGQTRVEFASAHSTRMA